MNPPGAGVERIDIGSVELDANGESAPISFQLPEDVVSFSIIIGGAEEGTFIIKRLENRTGVLVTDDKTGVTTIEELIFGPFAAQFKSPNRVVQDRGLAAFAFPNNPNVMIAGGNHAMVVAGFRLSGMQATPFSGTVEITVFYRRAEVVQGRLDVSLYFTGAGGLSADMAPSSQLITEALDHLRMIYAQSNIELGEVKYHDIDPSFQTIEGVDGSGDQLEQMFKSTAGNGPGLHYFFVERFEAGLLPGANVAGISGGLPGPGLNPGSVNSGVAVAMTPVNGDAAILAHVMAHEGGHWLGLFHTSEIIGTEDQMPDTPGGQQGNTFLMYPAVGGGTSVSPGQAKVMRHHPEVIAN